MSDVSLYIVYSEMTSKITLSALKYQVAFITEVNEKRELFIENNRYFKRLKVLTSVC